MADRKNLRSTLGRGVGSAVEDTANTYYHDNANGTWDEAVGAHMYVKQAGIWVAWNGAVSGGGGGGAATIADGADVAQGSTGDGSTANTVVGLLKALKAILSGDISTIRAWNLSSSFDSVNVGNFPGSQNVVGPLTDTQLRATAPHVIVDTAPTTAVTGPVTDTQLRASAVPVSVSTVPLPTGAAKDSTLTDGTLRVGGTVTISGAVTGPLTDTQLRASAVPVSAAALPLPAGAATDVSVAAIGTGQATTNAHLAAIRSALNDLAFNSILDAERSMFA